ncbi:putative lipid-binding protein AIR1 [Spinacia oleracea]|uniref:Lipid-binding protein AIR1 n=1 Tax=Spinacia oleracea TaxID=3562 RepID=A0A9R0HYH3_SPIOL|nr:putative lipid-binding protein AIR1 [Spinacia oleracea]
MASGSIASAALFLGLNLVLFNLALAGDVGRSLMACPSDALKLNACKDVFDLVHLRTGSSKRDSCCPVVRNLVNLDAAVCLCTDTVHSNVLGLNNPDINAAVKFLVIYCDTKLPKAFKCPPRNA